MVRADRDARGAAPGKVIGALSGAGGPIAARASKGLLAVLALGLALRIVLLLSLPSATRDSLFSDARLYHDWAAALARGEDFVGAHPYWLPPGYPILLSALYRVFGADPSVAILFQSLLGLLSVALVHGIGRRLHGEKVGVAAGVLAILYAPFAFFEGKVLPANVALPLLLLALALSLRDRPTTLRAAGSGLAGGLAVLLHPSAILPLGALGLSLALGGGRWRERAGRAAAFFLALLLPILPATARNLRISGQWALVSANGGANLYLGNGPSAGATFRSPSPEWGTIFEQRETAIRTASSIEGRAVDESEASRVLAREAARWVAANPGDAIALFAAKAAALVSTFEFDPLHGIAAERSLHPVLRIPFLPFAALLPLVVAGIFLARPPGAAGARIGAFVLGHAAISLLFFGYSRFRLAAVAALLPLAAAGALALVREGGRVRRRPVLVLLLAGSVGLSLVPLRTEKRLALARGHASVGYGALAAGDLEIAESSFHRALEASPTSVAARLGLAQVARSRGRDLEALEWIASPGPTGEKWVPLLLERGSLRAASTDPAIRDLAAAASDFRRVLDFDSGSEAALYGLGGVAYERAKGREVGDPLRATDLREAEKWFHALVDVHPDSEGGWRGLAESLRGLGREEEAAAAERRWRELALGPNS